MANEIIIPDFGTSVDQVVILKWLKNEGDHVAKGDPICELETDKATTELEAFTEGILLKQMVQVNDEVEIGSVIAYIGAPGENVPGDDTTADQQEQQTKRFHLLLHRHKCFEKLTQHYSR